MKTICKLLVQLLHPQVKTDSWKHYITKSLCFSYHRILSSWFFLTNQYGTQCLAVKGKLLFKVGLALYGLSFPWCTTQGTAAICTSETLQWLLPHTLHVAEDMVLLLLYILQKNGEIKVSSLFCSCPNPTARMAHFGKLRFCKVSYSQSMTYWP